MKALLFLVATFTVFLAKAEIATTSISIDSTKPLYIQVETKGIGPNLQCYFGATQRESFVFGVIMNYDPLSEEDGTYVFSQVNTIIPKDLPRLDSTSFASRLVCFVTSESTKSSSPRKISGSVLLYQNGDEILFSDSFTEMTRVGDSELWTTSLETKKIGTISVK